jgi:hypothetical protein
MTLTAVDILRQPAIHAAIDILADAGIEVPNPPDEDIRDWLYSLNIFLARKVHAINVVRGILLDIACHNELWRGKAESWSEYCATCGVNQYEASRLRTISRFMQEQGIDPLSVAHVQDTNKLHQIAVRAREKLATCPREDRESVISGIKRVVADAPHLSRADVMRQMDDLGMPNYEPCNSFVMQRVCLRTGEVNPRGCPVCVPGSGFGFGLDRPALAAGSSEPGDSAPKAKCYVRSTERPLEGNSDALDRTDAVWYTEDVTEGEWR